MPDDRYARALIKAHRAFADTLERELEGGDQLEDEARVAPVRAVSAAPPPAPPASRVKRVRAPRIPGDDVPVNDVAAAKAARMLRGKGILT